MHGYDVFFDYQSIDSGSFEKFILENIKARAHFIIILTPSALERCKNPGDWLTREIEAAIDENRNIVPLMLEGFDFGSPFVKEALTGKLALLSNINALPVPDAYALEAMGRLRERFLNVALSDVHLPALQAATEKPQKFREQPQMRLHLLVMNNLQHRHGSSAAMYLQWRPKIQSKLFVASQKQFGLIPILMPLTTTWASY